MTSTVEAFFDPRSNSFSYVVSDPHSGCCAIIDPVLDYDPAAGRIFHACVNRLIAHVYEHELSVQWVLDTHVHADHLSAAVVVQQTLGGRLATGAEITTVQATFAELFNLGDEFPRDGSQFDRLFADGDSFQVGGLPARAIHTPGHTPGCVSYLIGDAVFVGDALLLPDHGTARCDFPGGDARTLFASARKLFELPDRTRLFVGHDYQASGGDAVHCETTIGAQRRHNLHVREGVCEEQFVRLRAARDADLSLPVLMVPAIQTNIRAGHLPTAGNLDGDYLPPPKALR
ncbi:MBL fold metallo-hydrolase [Pseudomonas sp. UL073]|uniref:MBL fold metallo-hydrolase n=1 Tax=Zestomonas insulae TaxID=2809017 RepID=A0ABS2IEG3_9GAMM|nr:MBL fold metallo-hydrolase [Pseudomonas insulae]MBM7060275.1 MBL fold metallo-hydrolase [Pseudomonas insulae]